MRTIDRRDREKSYRKVNVFSISQPMIEGALFGLDQWDASVIICSVRSLFSMMVVTLNVWILIVILNILNSLYRNEFVYDRAAECDK